jgi:hypothetical protein
MSLSFTITTGPGQSNHSRVRVPCILQSHISDSSNLEGQVPEFISSRNRLAQLYLEALGSLFIASYDSQGYGGDKLKPPPRELNYKLQVKVKYTLGLTVSQSVSIGVEPHFRIMTRYLLLFDSYGLVFLGRPL